MTHVLSRANAPHLRRFLAGRVLLAFDFDGTLAPIVRDRDAARMRRRTRTLLQRVCGAYPCAVISGRGRADVEPRLQGLPFRYVVGNHGLDPTVATPALARHVARARAGLEAVLGAGPEIQIEDKTYSFAVHYRAARDRDGARRRIEQALAALAGAFRVVPGKLVFDVIPPQVSDKGAALARLIRRARVQAAMYVGDDVTDEDVFVLAPPAPLLTIRVGRSVRSAAAHFLRDQRELDQLLERLAAAREPPAPAGAARGRRHA